MFDSVDYSKVILNTIDNKVIKYIEKQIKKNNKTILWFNNTSGLTSEMLKILPNSNLISIRILGGLNKEKYYNDHYYERNTFGIYELSRILEVIEGLENGINPKWDQLERAKYIFSKLAHYIDYDHDKENRKGKNCSSLRALIDQKAICAGYALIFKELMDRQGIQCDYVRGICNDFKHAWNIITIDGTEYAIDVTNESGLIHEKKEHKDNYQFFGFSNIFSTHYKPDADERIKEYTPFMNQGKEIAKTVKYPDYKMCTRDDGTRFIIKEVSKSDNGLHEYIQCEIDSEGYLGPTNLIMSENDLELLEKDQTGLWYFVNSLLDRNRLQRYLSNGNGYIGYLDSDLKKVYDERYNTLDIEKKTYVRQDNSTVVLRKIRQDLEKNGIYQYNAYEFTLEDGVIDVEVNKIYSETDITVPESEQYDYVFANVVLERNRIKSKAFANAGYVGTVGYNGQYLNKVLYNESEEIINAVHGL